MLMKRNARHVPKVHGTVIETESEKSFAMELLGKQNRISDYLSRSRSCSFAVLPQEEQQAHASESGHQNSGKAVLSLI